MLEIRWHGRGGQGAKTASLLLADVAFSTGWQVQGFPEYGPERMGAPITAYNRLSQDKIHIYSNIYKPNIVVVVDESLVETVDVTAGAKKDGAIIVNTHQSPKEVKKMLGDYSGHIYAIDAGAISKKNIGKNVPNTPLLAAVVKISKIMKSEDFFSNMHDSFAHKFASKPEVIQGNLNAIQDAWQEVQKLS